MVTKTSSLYFDDRYFYIDRSNGGFLGPFQIGSYHWVADSGVTLGDAVPNWRGLISSGGNATTILQGIETKKNAVSCNVHYGSRHKSDPNISYSYQIYGNMLAYYLPVPTSFEPSGRLLEDADNQARTRFYSNLSETQAKFKGMVFSGELKESLELIRNPARSLRKGISDYLDHLKKNGPRKSRRDRPKFVRDSWLEYSFGWKPLVSDIDSAVSAFVSSPFTRPMFTMVRAKGSSTTQFQRQSLVSLQAGGGSLYIQFYPEVEDRAEVKYYGVYHSSGTGPSSFDHYGFSPWEFVPTVWELIPYSFLVDYFTNIGDLISSWSYRNIGVSWAAKGYVRQRRSRIVDAKLITEAPDDFEIHPTPGSFGSSAAEFSQKVRSPVSGVPLPSFRFEVPGMGTKWVNILALTNQLGSTRRSLAS